MTQITTCNRRQFLQYSAWGAGLALFPNLLHAEGASMSNAPSPNFNPDVEIEMSAQNAAVSIVPDGPKTKVQKYHATLLKGPKDTIDELAGNYLGPIFRFVKGQKVRVFFTNQLDEESVVHWHGLHVPQFSDGHPMYTMSPGQRFVYEFEVKNPAGTSFYHSHAHEKTGEQVYKGLAGLITVTDDEEKALNLPSGEYDLPLVIQDRSFDEQNQLQYLRMMMQGMMGFLGDTIVVNGKSDTEFQVKTRAYRVRAVNGSTSRIYKLGWLDGTPLTAIGTDACLLEKPETRPYIMLSPGERVDLWLDFSGHNVGAKLVLYSLPYTGVMPPMYERMHGGQGEHGGQGMGGGMGMMKHLPQGSKIPIVAFHVIEKVSDSPKLPEKLVAFKRLTEKDTDNASNPIPIAISEKPMAPQFNNHSFSMDQVLDFEKVKLGSIKKIKIFHDHGEKMAHGEKSTAASADDHKAMPAMNHDQTASKSQEKQGDMDMSKHSQSPQGGMGMEMMGGRHGGGMQMGGQGGHGGMGMMGGGMQGMGGMSMTMAHPVHMHGQQFQIISRKAGAMGVPGYETVKDGFIDTGCKDTVLVMPGEELEVIKPFQDFKGLFLYHCHNLDHEGLGMMRQFYVYSD